MSLSLMSLRMLRIPVRRTMTQSSSMIVLNRRNAGSNAEHHGPGIPFPPGPRQLEQAKNWYSSAATYGAAAFGLLCYFSDWKLVCKYIPFYNGKFAEEEERQRVEAEEAEEKKKVEVCGCDE